MNHKQFQEMIQLSFYDELAPSERAKLERHLATCSRCQAEQESLKSFYKTIEAFQPVSVRESDVVDARRALRMKLGSDAEAGSWVDKIIDMVTSPLIPQYRTVLVGAATLAIGIGMGYYFFGAQTSAANGFLVAAAGNGRSVFDQGEARVSNFRIVSKDETTGEVEFQFDATTPVHVTGNVKTDERVQKILARAAVSAENPGARLRAVATIAEHASGELQVPNDVKAALISAVKYDENRGVRQEALKALEKFLPDGEVVQAYIYVLKTEKNTGMKIAAINSLAKVKITGQPYSDELLNVLAEKVQSDENNYIRIRAKAALQEVKQQ